MKHRPYPEIVTRDEDWEVFEEYSTPKTNNLHKKMYVPMDAECSLCGVNHSRMIRRHELGHAKWSPKTIGQLPPNVVEKAVELLEEVRINHLLEMNNVGISAPVKCTEILEMTMREYVYTASLKEIMELSLASLWFDWKEGNYYRYFNRSFLSDEWFAIDKAVTNAVSEGKLSRQREQDIRWTMEKAMDFGRQLITRGNSGNFQYMVSFNKVKKVAVNLSLFLNEFSDRPNPEDVLRGKDNPIKTDEDGNPLELGEMGWEEKAEEMAPQNIQELEARNKREIFDNINNSREGLMNYNPNYIPYSGWADMQIIKPSLDVNLNGRIKNGRDYKPKEFGTNPKFIHRYTMDKKIFKQKQNVYGGTVLIDASGSMSFSGKDILEIMEQVPAVTIAMYNGSSSEGWLRIIAKNGRRVTEEYLQKHSGHGNGVDGLALKWLGTMPSKRLWVSDMMVFGRHYSNSHQLFKECVDTMNRYKITRVANIEEVKKFVLELNKV